MDISKNETFRKYFKIALIFGAITFFTGIVIGYFMNIQYTAAVIKYVVADSGSAQLMNITKNSDFARFIATFLNNLLVAGLMTIIPIHFSNLVRDSTENWTVKSKLSWLNATWLGYILIAFQMIGIGIFIGYAIPIINNSLVVIAALAPHGIIEIPVVLACSAIGMAYASREGFNYSFSEISNFFIKRIIPIIMIAAFIETYITPVIISLV